MYHFPHLMSTVGTLYLGLYVPSELWDTGPMWAAD